MRFLPLKSIAWRAKVLAPFSWSACSTTQLSTQAVWSALHLRAGERDIRIKRLDERALTHLEFLLSAGLYQ